jgi:hypothetical protein
MVRPDVLQKALEWGGRTIGIGASRKMGWGRFSLVGFLAESNDEEEVELAIPRKSKAS